MNKVKEIKLVCLLPYSEDTVPGQRFRWEQWKTYLPYKKIIIKNIYLLNPTYSYIESKSKFLSIIYFTYLYFVFFFKILINYNYDNFVIFRNCTLVGPPIIEFFLKVFNKKIIFDFDDAIYLGSENNDNWFIKNFIRCDWKIKFIIKISTAVICGNDLLKFYSKKYNSNSFVVPTTIDLKKYKSDKYINYKKKYLTVGWSGSYSTSRYIEKLLPDLFKLQKKIYFKIILIGTNLQFNNHYIDCIPWNSKKEIQDLLKIDIGLMPLPNNQWTRGKCGLKILQYLSLNIPSIASNVGINSKIIKNNFNGFLIKSRHDWSKVLYKLITNKKLFFYTKKNCQSIIKKNYTSSVACNVLNYKLRKIL
jgi:glycosyltransferase involved in cell wall biosynthesis